MGKAEKAPGPNKNVSGAHLPVGAWRTLAISFVSLASIACAPPKRNLAPVPGCIDAQVYVPQGCYKQTLPNGDVEVRCPTSTNTYHCTRKGK